MNLYMIRKIFHEDTEDRVFYVTAEDEKEALEELDKIDAAPCYAGGIFKELKQIGTDCRIKGIFEEVHD